MKLAYSRALVTGASAFIGSHLVQALAEAGVDVHALTLDGQLPDFLANQAGVTVQTGDITDRAAVERVVNAAKPDAIFHLAAYGTLTREREMASMRAVNVSGTEYLLQAAAGAGVRAFVYAGSAKEYAPSRVPISEDELLVPWDAYAAAKMAAGQLGRLVAEEANMAVTILRLSPVYGPGEDDSRFVPAAIRAALTGEPFHISVGPLVRNFTYVDDVVGAFMNAADRGEQGYAAFNIGHREAYSFDDILVAIETATGRPIARVNTRAAGARDDSWVLDSSRAERELGWQAKISLADGIAQAAQHYGQERWSTSTVSSVLSAQTKSR